MRTAPLIALCTILCATNAVQAQAPAPRQQPAATTAAPAGLQIPEPVMLVIMIRNTLTALNQANLSGNYSVLRDISAPAFQTQNSQAQLAVAFTSLRDQQLDISSILAVTPELSEQPAIDQNGVLKLVGFFPTEPLRVNFQLAFQASGGMWRPIGMAIGTSQSEPKRAAPTADARKQGQKAK